MGTGVKRALKPGNEWPPPNDRLVPVDYRPPDSITHQVSDGERWESLATRYGIPVKDLIWANFKTTVPAEVNWYLNHYVACDTPSPDGYNWRFTTSARKGAGPRAGIIFIPQRVAPQQQPEEDGAELLRRDVEDMRKTLKEIQNALRKGQESLNELQCALLTEAFTRKGVTTDRSLRYLSADELGVLLGFLECMILGSARLSSFLRGHPNASHSNPASPMGDMARLRIHADYHFKDAVAKEAAPIGDNTRGLFHPKTRSIHLPDDATFGQALHEAVHAFSTKAREWPVFHDNFGQFAYEGVTQLFTDMILEDRKWSAAASHDYRQELKCAKKMVDVFGLTAVANAYFGIEINSLLRAIGQRLKIDLGQIRQLARQHTSPNLRKGHVLCERLGLL